MAKTASTPPRELWPTQVRLREDSHRVPGVEKSDAETGKVLHVPPHEGKAVFKGRGGDHAIRRVERSPS